MRVLRWLDCVGVGTTIVGLGGQASTMVGLQWLGYSDGWAAVVRALQWFGCGVRGTTTVAGGGLDTTMVGLQWRG